MQSFLQKGKKWSDNHKLSFVDLLLNLNNDFLLILVDSFALGIAYHQCVYHTSSYVFSSHCDLSHIKQYEFISDTPNAKISGFCAKNSDVYQKLLIFVKQ